MTIRFPRPRRLSALCLAGVLLAGVAACGGSPGGDDNGIVTLRFGWWGNSERAAATQKVIDAFQAKNPNIKVKGEYTDFNGYFDKLATQVAGNDAPDIITLGGAYPREYGDRGALLDLSTVKDVLHTDKIGKAALDNGNFNNVQYGVPTGVNAIVTVIDPTVFDQLGVPEPQDNWTWDDFRSIAKQLADKAPKGTYALQDPTKTDMLDIWSRQQGAGLYTADGKVGISQQMLTDWWTMTTQLRDEKATPPASMTAELITQPNPEQSLIGRGQAAMQFDWSNELTALRKASGHPLKLMRVPGETEGTPGEWLQASQLYSIYAKTEHPKEAAKFVDFLINSPEAGAIIKTDRGVPTNSDVRAALQTSLEQDQADQVKFIDELTPKAGTPLVIGPTGSTETPHILDRVNAEVLFGRQQPAEAAADFIKQVTAAIQQ
jgi:multiple sugar transport system substrate-binding protein